MAMFEGLIEMLAGDPFAAERAFDEAERIAVEVGDRWFQSTIVLERAHAVLAQARPHAGAQTVARIDDVTAPGDVEWRFKRHLAHAKLAAQEGDAERALPEARVGVELADRTQHFTFRADAHRDLAEIAARFGRGRRGPRRGGRRARAVRGQGERRRRDAAAGARLGLVAERAQERRAGHPKSGCPAR
jgi:hypothetical protein